MSPEPLVPDPVAVRHFLSALYRGAPQALVEVRFRLERGMGQTFHPVAKLGAVADTVLARSAVTDVFVGVVPRSRRGGGRADLIRRSTVVWADCDDTASVAALNTFHPSPSMVVASGTDNHRHAYWFLREAIDFAHLESINRGLALTLGADQRSANASRILRPAGSLNHKHCPLAKVRLLRLDLRTCVALGELQVALPFRQGHWNTSPRQRQRSMAASDSLLAIPPQVYVPRLTGRGFGRPGKIRCPFHDDRTPSLHVYGDPERGWHCFGCGRGGSIYDLAATLWQRGTRGGDFLELRRDLEAFLSEGPRRQQAK